MVEAMGLSKDQVINKYNIGEDEGCAAAIDELIEAGCQIIFATSFGHGDYMKEAAAAHPKSNSATLQVMQLLMLVFPTSITISPLFTRLAIWLVSQQA
jgi:hypothetical protein